MGNFYNERTQAALDLGNRGTLRIDSEGQVDEEILSQYSEKGFYVFEDVIDTVEIEELRREFHELLDRVPTKDQNAVDSADMVNGFDKAQRRLFHYVRPLSDPYGGTGVTNSRYQVKLTEPSIPEGAPKDVLLQIGGILQFLDAALRIYGHPSLLSMAAAVNGDDFTPFTEVIWLKQPRIGAAVAWHQDGTTHWENPSLDRGTHGFNFMLNLYETTAQNALWVVPGTHKEGKANIKAMLENSDTEHLDGSVPLLCKPGDVAIVSRQLVHGSFPNESPQPRYTFVFGFHRRSSVDGVQGWGKEPYNDKYIEESSRIIPLAIAARKSKFANETEFNYLPFVDKEKIRWDEANKREILKHYHRRMIGI